MNKYLAMVVWACGAGAAQASVVAGFDDLAAPPALTSATGLQFTNASNSLQYQGATWDSRFTVVGDQYRVGNGATDPVFGIPHAGHYFVTNGDGATGLEITTAQVLTGAWLGRNQYYGFTEGGADQITIVALSGTVDLLALVFDLPDGHPGQPEPLSFADTSAFASLGGITGYRIDRREVGTQAGHWVADDFQFATRQEVPEPDSLALVVVGFLAWAAGRRVSTYKISL